MIFMIQPSKFGGLSSSQFFDAFKQLAGCCQHSPLGTLRISHLRSGAEYEHRVTRCRTSDLEALQSAAQMGGQLGSYGCKPIGFVYMFKTYQKIRSSRAYVTSLLWVTWSPKLRSTWGVADGSGPPLLKASNAWISGCCSERLHWKIARWTTHAATVSLWIPSIRNAGGWAALW